MNTYEKIFVIGSNKTGTSSLHGLFLKNGFNSQHGLDWELEKYQCFSDGIYNNTHNNTYKNCYEKFPNSLFILNTRPLYNWLYSRANHSCRYKLGKMKEGWPPSYDVYLDWVNWRTDYYNEILNYFVDMPNQLIICNIEKPNWEDFVLSFIDINKKDTSPCRRNKTKQSEIKEEETTLIKEKIEEVFSKNNIDKNNLLPDNNYISLYKCFL